jgi:hypothetical protein
VVSSSSEGQYDLLAASNRRATPPIEGGALPAMNLAAYQCRPEVSTCASGIKFRNGSMTFSRIMYSDMLRKHQDPQSRSK